MAERNEVTSKKANPSSFQSKLIKIDLHSGKLTSQWKVDPLKMYFLLKMGIIPASYISLPEG